MAGPNVLAVGVGTGQPHRPDFEGQAHQANLRPGHALDIPKQTVGGTKNRGADKRTGWARQEQAYEVGGQHFDGHAEWGDFTGDRRRGPNRGAVHVDGANHPPINQRPNDVVARHPEDWVRHAAALEERFRLDGEKYGINAELKLPGDGPEHGGPTGLGRRNQRRAFTLKHG